MLISVAVKTDSKEESVSSLSDTRLEICVHEPAERNAANKRVLELVRMRYPGKLVWIVHGHHSSGKIISIDVVERRPDRIY
jgi:uncharacterized protein YggU (UPF0235/DUF167 family)